jgi:hypothetical protein
VSAINDTRGLERGGKGYYQLVVARINFFGDQNE